MVGARMRSFFLVPKSSIIRCAANLRNNPAPRDGLVEKRGAGDFLSFVPRDSRNVPRMRVLPRNRELECLYLPFQYRFHSYSTRLFFRQVSFRILRIRHNSIALICAFEPNTRLTESTAYLIVIGIKFNWMSCFSARAGFSKWTKSRPSAQVREISSSGAFAWVLASLKIWFSMVDFIHFVWK